MYICHIIYISNPICIFKLTFKRTLTSFKFFFNVLKTHIINMINIFVIKTRLNIFRCFLHSTHFSILLKNDFIHCTINNIIIIFLPINVFIGKGLCLWHLVGLLSTYLEPRSPRTLNSSDECLGPCMRQFFDSPFGWSTYICLHMTYLSLIVK